MGAITLPQNTHTRSLPSDSMGDDTDREPTQRTKPQKGEPIEIPVPKKGDVMRFLEKAANLPDPERPAKSEGRGVSR